MCQTTLLVIVRRNPSFFLTLRLNLTSPLPLEFVFILTFRQLGLMLGTFPMTFCLLIFLLGLSLVLCEVRSHNVIKSEANPELYKQLYLELFASFPLRFLLMVLNVVTKLLQLRLQMATFKLLHCIKVCSLTTAQYILL